MGWIELPIIDCDVYRNIQACSYELLNPLIDCDVHRYSRSYTYEMIESLSDETDIETLVDSFKKEVFEQYKLSKRTESEE